jgi:hypothetical protein
MPVATVVWIRWSMLSLTLSFAPSIGTPGDSKAREDWPTLQSGIWETECTRTLPSGKTQHWNQKVSHCRDATELLRGYWGLGLVEEAGCRYEAEKISTDQFKITSECMVRHAGVAKSSATAVVKNADAFEMRVDVIEGKKVYHGAQTGHRRSACPDPAGSR